MIQTDSNVPKFTPGHNLAMKVPAAEYDETLAFYRDVLKLPQLLEFKPAEVFDFDGKRLWIDRSDTLETAEMWLEITCDDPMAAEAYLKEKAISRQKVKEDLPEGHNGFWIRNPADVVHLVSEK